MRKMRPGDVVDDFQSQITELQSYYTRVASSLRGIPTAKADTSRLAEQTFVSAVVAFEGFLSDLMIAYLNRDPSKYQATKNAAITQSLSDIAETLRP